ncbi:response regulator [Frankia sp. CiP1_Cm_nod1]|uniref:response regulator n=1 Tax=Frankia sp. CiP1_Cm_nod1 TaxID=2897160 RepID=UPI004044F98C
MRVVLCDGHRMFVEGMATMLTARGWTVCAVAFTAADAENAIRCHRPDLGMIDLGFPDGDGLDLIRSLAGLAPVTNLLLLTGSTDVAAISAAIRAGAGGMASKTQDIERVIAIAERVGRGKTMTNVCAVVRGARTPRRSGAPATVDTLLTSRERDVLVRLGRGQSTAVLAADLGITVNTARSHIQNVLTKLGVHSRLEAAALAARSGLLDRAG